MDDVKAVSNSYVPLASAMAAVYFSLERLGDISFLYQFSLQFFLDMISRVLVSSADVAPPVGEPDPKFARQRLQVLSQVCSLLHSPPLCFCSLHTVVCAVVHTDAYFSSLS